MYSEGTSIQDFAKLGNKSPFVDFKYSDSDNSFKHGVIDNLKNGTSYVFKFGVVDQAGNVSNFQSARNYIVNKSNYTITPHK